MTAPAARCPTGVSYRFGRGCGLHRRPGCRHRCWVDRDRGREIRLLEAAPLDTPRRPRPARAVEVGGRGVPPPGERRSV